VHILDMLGFKSVMQIKRHVQL